MTEQCADVRAALGVYVVGAIDPAERARVDAHLAGCPACRDELAALAGLPALLGRVDEEQLTRVAGPPPELLDALLARAAERRRGPFGGRWPGARARRWAPVAAAACLTLAVGGLAGGLIAAAGDGPGTAAAPPATSAPPSPTRVTPAERIEAANDATGVHGYVLLHERKWGTEVELHLSGLERGARCRLQVIARDGRRDALGSWYVPYDDGYGEYRGSTMFPRGELSTFEIVGLDGEAVLTIPM
ncbi:zf-HC2 domain-containing protein [Actinomadura sp. WMMB 499]|uniref:zf-HC2 domain-containing protein n=1 Tax=Actinomadura sp. WMMB 499 TaxID=1219491 RepID=UPI00159D0FF4|nr:zf-HC2 domain-containing protein [Actinomadura sp. WMMB 499]